MTLVVSIGTAVLPATLAATVGTVGAGIAGTAVLGAVGTGVGMMANDAVKAGEAQRADAALGQQRALAAATPAAGLPAAMAPTDVSSPMASMGSIGQDQKKAATGGIMLADGGQVPVRNGAYIIPADVVSALGNGSSKAGAEFLRRLMNEVKNEATKRHGLGAVKRDAA